MYFIVILALSQVQLVGVGDVFPFRPSDFFYSLLVANIITESKFLNLVGYSGTFPNEQSDPNFCFSSTSDVSSSESLILILFDTRLNKNDIQLINWSILYKIPYGISGAILFVCVGLMYERNCPQIIFILLRIVLPRVLLVLMKCGTFLTRYISHTQVFKYPAPQTG